MQLAARSTPQTQICPRGPGGIRLNMAVEGQKSYSVNRLTLQRSDEQCDWSNEVASAQGWEPHDAESQSVSSPRGRRRVVGRLLRAKDQRRVRQERRLFQIQDLYVPGASHHRQAGSLYDSREHDQKRVGSQ